MRGARVWVGASLLVGSCVAEPRPHPSPAHGKLELFGDASLIPTREGERARRELAIAGELEQALLALGFASAHVDVELRERPAVLVIARRGADPGATTEPTEAHVAALVQTLVELERDDLRLFVLPTIAEPPTPERRLDGWAVALLLTGLGLGVSLGVLGERLRARW